MNVSKGWKLLWSVMVLAAICLLVAWWLYPSRSKLGYGFDLFVYYMLGWAIAFGGGVVALFLRLLRVVKDRGAFGYIFLGVTNFLSSLYGTLEFVKVGWGRGALLIPILMIVSFCVGVTILADAIIYELLSIRRKN
jgi:hypothetical protein